MNDAIRASATFVSPQHPVSYRPIILKSKFAEACCKIWDEFEYMGENCRTIYCRSDVSDNGEYSKIVHDYLKYVIDSFRFDKKKHAAYYEMPEHILENIDVIIHNNLKYFQWAVMQIDYLNIDRENKIIPIHCVVNEYVVDYSHPAYSMPTNPMEDTTIFDTIKHAVNECYDEILIDAIKHTSDDCVIVPDRHLSDIIKDKSYRIMIKNIRFNLNTIDNLLY